MINLPTICEAIQLAPKVVCEVGVNEPDKCSFAWCDEIKGISVLLVEPLPWCAENLRQAFPNATVIEAACGPEKGTTRLFDRGEGSWIEQVPEGSAPDEHRNHSNMKRQEFEARFIRETKVVRFADIDPGDIDILCVDIEGAEWFVIQQMISRPRLVRVETHFSHSGYENPHLKEIKERMADRGYRELMQDVSDTLWIL